MNLHRWSNRIFAILLVIALLLFAWVLSPFFSPLLLGAFIVVLVHPAYRWLARLFGGHHHWAALVSTIAVFVLILLPIALVITLVIQQLLAGLDYLRDQLGEGGLSALVTGHSPLLRSWLDRVQEVIPITAEQIRQGAIAVGQQVGGWVPGLVGGTLELLLDTFILFIALYYFFVDGRRIVFHFMHLLPLEDRYSRDLFAEFHDISYAMLYSNIMAGIIQGALGGIGYWIFGIPSPLVWATFIAIFSFLPAVGTGAVTIPTVIVLLLLGDYFSGVGLLIYSVVIIGGSDNLVRPLLARGHIRMHPLLVFLSIFGGLQLFGLIGVLVGPLLVGWFVALVRIYQRDFLP